MTKPATIDIDRDKAYDWLLKGAQPTDTVRAILRFKGILYRKHLMRGVNKGAMTQEDADRMYQEWIDSKESKIASRVEETKKEIKKHHENIFGVPVAKKAPEPEPAPEVEEPVAEAVEEVAEEVAVEAVEAVEEVAEVAEVVEAEAPAVEAAAEEPVAEAAAEEAPAAEEEEEEKKAE